MIRNASRIHFTFVLMFLFLLAGSSPAFADGGAVLDEATGLLVAERAEAYADVAYAVGGEEHRGVPYLLGGRTTLSAFEQLAAGDEPATGLPDDVGLDASGVVVAVLKDLDPNVRFAASEGSEPVLWADANSSSLARYNIVRLPAAELRAGDLLFFGSDEAITGTAVITGRAGTRIDFVVASAGQGRVIRTFARTDGEYWRDNIVGGGRLALPVFEVSK